MLAFKRCVAVLVLAVGVAGCANPDKSRDDARDTLDVDHSPPHVLQFSNHYPNVEFKCNGQSGVYVTTHDSARGRNFQVVPSDPACGEAARQPGG